MLFSEPKIPQSTGTAPARGGTDAQFQCSSASRKFLNSLTRRSRRFRSPCFSALQRAENSSIKRCVGARRPECPVSVLFSEPKIPQYSYCRRLSATTSVSVLFSEPKIPQSFRHLALSSEIKSFSALQRAENSSIPVVVPPSLLVACFSALQRAENSSMGLGQRRRHQPDAVSVLFSEPKIPQLSSSAAAAYGSLVSVLFSEPKIPQC